MPNQHAVSIPLASLPFSIPSTAEIVILTMTPFSENQPPGAFSQALAAPSPNPGPQGVVLDANLNVTATTGTITLRFRYTGLTGGIVVGTPTTGYITTTTTAVAVTAPAFGIDPTLVELNAVYVLTAQLSAGTGSVSYAMMTAQDATSFE